MQTKTKHTNARAAANGRGAYKVAHGTPAVSAIEELYSEGGRAEMAFLTASNLAPRRPWGINGTIALIEHMATAEALALAVERAIYAEQSFLDACLAVDSQIEASTLHLIPASHPSGAAAKGSNAAELFERGYKVVHGTAGRGPVIDRV